MHPADRECSVAYRAPISNFRLMPRGEPRQAMMPSRISEKFIGAYLNEGTLPSAVRSADANVEDKGEEEKTMGRGLLLWLIGIPLPIILLIWLFGGLH